MSRSGSRLAKLYTPPLLFFAALACFVFAIGDVHASPLRAAIAIVVGAALWLVGEWWSR